MATHSSICAGRIPWTEESGGTSGTYSPRGHKESNTTENLSTKSFGKVMYTLLYLKWLTNKNLLNSTCNYSMLCASLDGTGLGDNGYMYMYG